MTFIAVRCPHCQREQIVKRGETDRGTQRYLCQNTTCVKGSFLLDYCNRIPSGFFWMVSIQENTLPPFCWNVRLSGPLCWGTSGAGTRLYRLVGMDHHPWPCAVTRERESTYKRTRRMEALGALREGLLTLTIRHSIVGVTAATQVDTGGETQDATMTQWSEDAMVGAGTRAWHDYQACEAIVRIVLWTIPYSGRRQSGQTCVRTVSSTM
jgi:hypothetical protein